MTLSVSLCAAQSPKSSESEKSAPGVLVLNSYHTRYTWSDREMDGVIDTLEKSGLKYDLHVEFLDSKHFHNNEHFEQVKDLIAVKYSKNRPAVVMALDNPAFEFAVKYRKRLFSGIPVVFAGLNDYEPEMLKGETGITGIVEKQDIVGTVKLAKALQPDLREVVILHDFTSSGLASLKEAQEQLAGADPAIKFRYLPDMTMDEIASTLKELKSGTIVIAFSYSRDKAGRIFNHSELAEIVSKSSAVPVYGTKEERLGFGIIGGSLLEGRTHGALGAELAVRILRGESPAAIPVVTDPKSRVLFDYRLLKRFRISPDSLPPGSEMINRPIGFYRQHAVVINVASGIILLLTASFLFVFVANRRRRKAEKALIESERGKSRVLEAANVEMESFCYAVSHDLQTPLRHIHSFTSIIEEDYGSRLDDQGIHILERLKSASLRMGELIRDLLTLSQVSRGEINRTRFDLGELALSVFEELQSHDSSRYVKMTVEESIEVYADQKLIRVILDNLVGNAWKYTSKVSEALIQVGTRTEDGRCIYFIRDNGVGFDMKYAEMLFTPFQRLHETSEFEGTGIGLATVQRVINRHGGEIWADSSPGKGATFFFTLKS